MDMDTLKQLYGRFRQILDYIGRRQISAIASAGAFWFFLSLVPLVILASSLLPYTSVTQGELLSALTDFAPESLRELLTVIIADVYRSNLAVISVSLLGTVWSSSTGFSSLIRGLEEIYDQPRRTGYFLRRGRAVLCTLALLGSLLLAITLMGLGNLLLADIERGIPASRGVFAFFMQFRFLASVAVLTLAFAAVFKWGPSHKRGFSRQLPGALFSALGWSLFSWVFSQWVSATGGYGTYGSLATVVAVMLWLYYCMYILLLGACLNRALCAREEPEK